MPKDPERRRSTRRSDDDLLRAIGAAIVLIAALWFGALAASPLDRGPAQPDAA
jgi:hypothetical protein